MTIKEVLNMGLINNEEMFIRDDDFHLLAHGVKGDDSIREYENRELESFTWDKDGTLYFDVKNNEPLRIIIAANPNPLNYPIVEKRLLAYLKEKSMEAQIISGKQRGVHTLGEQFAADHGYKIVSFPEDWIDGKNENSAQDKKMVEYASNAHGVLFAFWDGESCEIKSMIQIAKLYGLEIQVVLTRW